MGCILSPPLIVNSTRPFGPFCGVSRSYELGHGHHLSVHQWAAPKTGKKFRLASPSCAREGVDTFVEKELSLFAERVYFDLHPTKTAQPPHIDRRRIPKKQPKLTNCQSAQKFLEHKTHQGISHRIPFQIPSLPSPSLPSSKFSHTASHRRHSCTAHPSALTWCCARHLSDQF